MCWLYAAVPPVCPWINILHIIFAAVEPSSGRKYNILILWPRHKRHRFPDLWAMAVGGPRSVDCLRCTCIIVLHHYHINAAGIGAAAWCVIARLISADEAAIRVRVDLLGGTCEQPQLSAKTAVLAPELCLSGRHQAVNETRARACTRTRTRTRARCAAGVGHLRAQAGVGGGHPRRRRRRPPPPLLTAAAGLRLAVRLGPNQN